MKHVIAISGSEEFLRLRNLRAFTAGMVKKNWALLGVDASEPGSLLSAFSQAAMFGTPTLAVVHNPEKELTAIENHLKSGDDSVVLLLHHEGDPKGNTKFGKFLLSLGADHKNFAAPEKQWQQEKNAEAFCVAEAKAHGLRMDPKLALMLVAHTGTDLGVLSFEILKAATLTQADGLTEITVPVVRSCLSTVTEGGIQQVMDALAARSAKKMSQALRRVYLTHKDPIMLTCRAIEAKAYSWLPMVRAREEGKTPKQAAEDAGINVWFYETKLFPQTVKWSTSDLLDLVQAMAVSERALLQGTLDPWTGLVVRLLGFCDKKPTSVEDSPR